MAQVNLVDIKVNDSHFAKKPVVPENGIKHVIRNGDVVCHTKNNFRTQQQQGNKRCNDGEHVDADAKSICIRNSFIRRGDADHLYHLAINTTTTDMIATFGDIKYVVLGGSANRMEQFAKQVRRELLLGNHCVGDSQEKPTNFAKGTDRYVLYKIGPVLIASHGIGVNSLSVVMHELFKLLHHACVTNVTFFRIGTCGGLGIPAGSLVITEEAVDGMFRPQLDMVILGKPVSRPAILDQELAKQLMALACHSDDGYETVTGRTMCASDFYEGQARLDGAFCDFMEADKMEFLQHAHDQGVRNIEMESVGFAAYCHRAGVKGAVVCVTLLNRFISDQLTASHADYVTWTQRPGNLVIKFINRQLATMK